MRRSEAVRVKLAETSQDVGARPGRRASSGAPPKLRGLHPVPAVRATHAPLGLRVPGFPDHTPASRPGSTRKGPDPKGEHLESRSRARLCGERFEPVPPTRVGGPPGRAGALGRPPDLMAQAGLCTCARQSPALPSLPAPLGRKWGTGPGGRQHSRSKQSWKGLGVPMGTGRGRHVMRAETASVRLGLPSTWGTGGFLSCLNGP